MWYTFQLTIMSIVIYYYIYVLKTHQPLQDVVLLAILVAFGMTWVLTRIGRLWLWVYRKLRLRGRLTS